MSDRSLSKFLFRGYLEDETHRQIPDDAYARIQNIDVDDD